MIYFSKLLETISLIDLIPELQQIDLGDIICYTAVFSVVTQRSSLLVGRSVATIADMAIALRLLLTWLLLSDYCYLVYANNDGDDLEQSFNVFSPVLECDQSNAP